VNQKLVPVRTGTLLRVKHLLLENPVQVNRYDRLPKQVDFSPVPLINGFNPDSAVGTQNPGSEVESWSSEDVRL
jgi:hypothetical protein